MSAPKNDTHCPHSDSWGLQVAPGQPMEPAETTPSHCPRGGEGKVGADEREDVGHSCADSCDSSTGLEQSSAATQQLGCSAARPVKQARPACSVHPDQDGGRDADVLVHVLNLFPDGGQMSGKLTSCPVPGPSPTLETGFADSILFFILTLIQICK